MLIQYKLQPHPNDGSPLKRRSRHRKIARNFAKEKDNCGGKASFAHFWHPDMRSVHTGATPTGAFITLRMNDSK